MSSERTNRNHLEKMNTEAQETHKNAEEEIRPIRFANNTENQILLLLSNTPQNKKKSKYLCSPAASAKTPNAQPAKSVPTPDLTDNPYNPARFSDSISETLAPLDIHL